MRLDVDLGFDAVPGWKLAPGEAHTLDLHELAGKLRQPRALVALLRSRHYDELRVRQGALPLSSVQAAVLLALGLVRTPRVIADERSLSRARFIAHAAARLLWAVPSELGASLLLALRVRRAATRSFRLPITTSQAHTAIYLRVDPSLRWLGRQVGGAATHTSGVINGLTDNGVAVEVLAVERPLETERASYTEVPVRRVMHLVRGLTYTAYGGELVKAVGRRNADFVYQRYQLGAYAGLALARRLRVPLVLEFNGSEIWVERHWMSGKVRLERSLTALERRNLRDASLVVVVSESLRRFVIDQGVDAERVLLNPNGVDIDALAPYRERSPAQWRAQLGQPDQPTVGFIGTFGLWHGVRLLPHLIAAVPEARWILVGDGGLMPEVRGEIESRGLVERVELTGVVEHSRALALLACCDVCVSPHVPNPDGTPFFGSPTKLFEYMGLAKAIVASDLDQVGEVIENGRTGLLCAPGDVEAAAAGIHRLLEDAELRARLGSAAFEQARDHYSWRAHAQRILEALSGLSRTEPVARLLA